MKLFKRSVSFIAAVLLIAVLCVPGAFAKTVPNGQTVETVLFYVANSDGEDILAARIPVAQMEADMRSGLIDDTNHNYSLLDRYVTTLHQEAQGFTAPEFVAYAQSKSTVPEIREAALTFTGEDKMSFWEIDQSGYDDLDCYSWNELYGVQRYNFPLLYEYWNYRTQDYYDPAGRMSREEVIDHIFANGEPEVFLLSVRAFSQRFMITEEKYDAGDYNMENYWLSEGMMDNLRAIRMMMGMTEEELRGRLPTASNTRYWCANIRLTMADAPKLPSLGEVAAPTASVTENGENYYVTFDCATPGATILYNHNYISPSYTPTCVYEGEPVAVPKQWFGNGTVTMTCRAVKDGWTDAGVVTLTPVSSGEYSPPAWVNPYSDVKEGAWYYDYVKFADENAYFDPVGENAFGPDEPMTRAMLATALYRLAGRPGTQGITSTPFTDVAPYADYADAVAWCRFAGVVNGTSETTFAPEDTVTREQIVTMFHRYAAQVAKADMTPCGDLSAFTDADRLASWAEAQMRWAVAAGLINGTSATTLTPQGTATRAQTAALVQRLAAYVE